VKKERHETLGAIEGRKKLPAARAGGEVHREKRCQPRSKVVTVPDYAEAWWIIFHQGPAALFL
jgi:hypothetical protein